jgi:hypothetical protein
MVVRRLYVRAYVAGYLPLLQDIPLALRDGKVREQFVYGVGVDIQLEPLRPWLQHAREVNDTSTAE